MILVLLTARETQMKRVKSHPEIRVLFQTLEAAEKTQQKNDTPKVDRRKNKDKAKQLSENKNSLRRIKKHDAVKSIVQRLPSEVKSSRSSGTGGLYDSIHMGSSIYKTQEEDDPHVSDSDVESIYESRKLLIRQMQGQIAKQVHEGRDSVSEYDSWTDLEENFALAYEPIPLSIKLDTWRKMSKREILRKVNSKKIRKDFEYLTHSEILVQIEKMQKNAKYLSAKFGINHLMPQLDHVALIHRETNSKAEVDEMPEDETDIEESEGEVSQASFVSGREIYLSRAEILNKIYDVSPNKSSSKQMEKPRSPTNSSPSYASCKDPTENNIEKPKLPKKRMPRSNHDSWSSRASSILKDPEAIYVSRVELLKKIDVLDDPKQNPAPVKKGRKSRTPNGRRQHDSWSSRASSILAAVEAEQQTLQDDEPLYISRVELLKNLQMKSLEALSAASEQSLESDSDASTVKNASISSSTQRKWKSQKLKFEQDMINAIHGSPQRSVRVHTDSINNNNSQEEPNANVVNQNRNIVNPKSPVQKESLYDSQIPKKNSLQRESSHESSRSHETSHTHNANDGEWDSCSCVTCNTCQQSDCSCSDVSDSSNASRSSHSSDGSVETIIGKEDKIYDSNSGRITKNSRKHSDIYIVNGSDVSKASSKASSKVSKKSSNYDPLPQNGITKVKHTKLSQVEIEKERISNEQEIRLRSQTSETEKRKEKIIKKPSTPVNIKDTKGTAKSTKSWTNDEFAMIYEPVSAEELRKQSQVRDLKRQLKTLSPEWDKTVDSINTMRRKKVLRQLKAVVTQNVDLDKISEEDLGKHLDKALRQALDQNYEALSNLNLGAMYVPMEQNPSNSKVVSRENTDYDTFGSIDSLIFEPKIPSQEDIEEAQEEITQSFEYLENEDDGHAEVAPAENSTIKEALLQFQKPTRNERRSPKHDKNAMAVGKTTFAERVKLFQSLGDKKTANALPESNEIETGNGRHTPVHIRGSPTIDSFLHSKGKAMVGQTTWKEQALTKTSERSGRESAASLTSHSTNSSGSTVIYNVNTVESRSEKSIAVSERDIKTSSITRRGSFLDQNPTLGGIINQNDSEVSPSLDPSHCSACRDCSLSCCKSANSNSGGTESSCDCFDERNPSKISQFDECSCEDCPECSLNVKQIKTKIIQNIATIKDDPNNNNNNKNNNNNNNNIIDNTMTDIHKTDIQQRPRTPKSVSPSNDHSGLRNVDSVIPIVGNLRRQLRETFNKPTMNIEKKKQKNGFIIEDDEEHVNVQRAPSVENMTNISQNIKERLERADSFQKRQMRNQFRSISPVEQQITPTAQIIKHVIEEKAHYHQSDYKKSGLLVEVENGVPLIYKNGHQHELEIAQNVTEQLKTLELGSPKSKGSDMGDSGISSNPASISTPGMSPNSTSSNSSSESPKEKHGSKEPDIQKKMVPPGGRKRDTMIRELKSKLKERFPTNTLENKGEPKQKYVPFESQSIRSTKAEVGPKLTKIFGALMNESGQGQGQTTLTRAHNLNKQESKYEESQEEYIKEKPYSRNLQQYNDGMSTLRSSKLSTVDESDYSETIDCESSIYDPSLPPGYENHIQIRSPPPPPPPTQASSKRGSMISSNFDEMSIPSRPSSSAKSIQSIEKNVPIDKREMLYGPGGIFGSKGPFSTPQISRYPEVTPQKRTSFSKQVPAESHNSVKSSTTSITEESGMFAEDRSDKSQYICNPVITVPNPHTSSRLENYRSQVSPDAPIDLTLEQLTALAIPVNQEVTDKWLEEKQKRMINWINKSQVALGSRETSVEGMKKGKVNQ